MSVFILQTLTTIHTQGEYRDSYHEGLIGFINYPVALELMKRDFEEKLLHLPENDEWQQGLLDLVNLHLDAFYVELAESYKDSRAAGGGAITDGDEVKRALVPLLLLSKDKEIEPRYKQTCRFCV